MGRSVDVKDEGNGTHNVERISQSDALGRLTSVCEVTGAVQAGISPGSCGLDYSGTGFLTTYSYNPRGDLTDVAQGTLQGRHFDYDLQSRLTHAFNPESNDIYYSYDSDTNCPQQAYAGELISKTDARGTRTCFQYDAMHRVTAKTYSDGATPSVTYGYSETSKYGHALANTLGRKSSESTAGTNPTGSVFSYDELGHIIDNAQCTPFNCSSSPYAINYFQPNTTASSYNVLGEAANFSNGAGVTFTYGYNSTGGLASLSSSLADANHPATLLNNVTYNAFGSPLTSTIGSAPLLDSRGYDPRGRVSEISVIAQSSLGTGSVTVGGPGEQSTQVQTHAATQATATITVGGAEQHWHHSPCTEQWQPCSVYDSGDVYIFNDSGGYDEGSTETTVATSLSSRISSDPSSPVTVASQSGSSLTLTTKASGSAANISFSTSYDYDDYDTNPVTGDPLFTGPSFQISPSSGTFSGGQDAQYATVYDSGTASITVGTQTDSYSWGNGASASSIASGLASAINADSAALVWASPTGSTVNLRARNLGANGASLSSGTTYDSADFGSASFTVSSSASTLSGAGALPIYSVTGPANGGTQIQYAPNGDILGANDSINGNWTYTYDDFNRLNTAQKSATEGCSWTYDRYGNRFNQDDYTPNAVTCAWRNFQSSTHNDNRLDYFWNSYDAAGNLLADDSHDYVYDAENRIACVDPVTPRTCADGSAASYVYDAEGRRVRKTTGSTSVDYLYDLAGHVISEMNSSGGWNRGEVYAGGQHLATYSGGTSGTTYFTHSDWLGTERVRTDASGNQYETCTNLPYGDALSCTINGVTSGSTSVSNPSFETPTLPGGAQASDSTGSWTNSVANWTQSGSSGVFLPSTVPFPNGTTNGSQVLWIWNGSVQQTLSATVAANTAYTLQVDVGQRADDPPIGYTIQLLAGSTVVASDDSSRVPASGTWQTSTLNWSSASDPSLIGQALTISMSETASQPDFDNVRLTATTGSGSDPSPDHFTGKQRDTESNLDYFGARYYGSTPGRFMTPDWADKPTDVPYAQFGDPQSLNLYGYVGNNPVSHADTDGHADDSLNTKVNKLIEKGLNVLGGKITGIGEFSVRNPDDVETAVETLAPALNKAASVIVPAVLSEGASLEGEAAEIGAASRSATEVEGTAAAESSASPAAEPTPVEPYNRSAHYGNPSTSAAAQDARAAGEGQPCPRCGETMQSGTRHAPTAEHQPTLKGHYYSEGHTMTPAERKAYARSSESLSGSMCKRCQSVQGAEESRRKY